jgi:hypothetical protein
MYFSAADKGQFAAMVYNWPVENVRTISTPISKIGEKSLTTNYFVLITLAG